MNKSKIAILFFLLSILFSCDKYDLVRVNTHDPKSPDFKADIPTVTTTSTVTNITTNTATSGGNVTSNGGANLTARGVVWSTSTNPVVTLSTKTTDGTGTGLFSSSLTNLTPSTTYYVRAYATNSSGTGYGLSVIFSTKAEQTAPLVTTAAPVSVGLTKALGGGAVTADGGSSVTERGICWSTTANPTTALTTKAADDSLGVGTFRTAMSGLTAGTQYHIRAYAVNSTGTGYGNDVTFTTLTVAAAPTITTTAASAIAMTTAVSGGNITFDGGADITARGVCWSTAANPTTGLTTKTSDGTGAGSFSSSITGLTAGTLYHIRAYATNPAGTSYGSDLTFTTNTVAVIPTVTTTAATNLTLSSLTSGGNVISDGGATVTTRGICYGTTANPTISSSRTYDGTGTGVFTSSLTYLSANTTYHIRAYATNSAGTGYGQDISVTTPATAQVPTITTTVLTAVTFNSASGGGTISSDGGASVTAKGVCWSTTENPTVSLTTKTNDGTGTAAFTSSLTGLTGNTTYHVRAYATNSAGTGYGTDLTFTTQAPVIPTITTTTVTDNLGTTATSGGTISSDGGSPISAKGVCWGTAANPTTTLTTKTSDGTGSGSFSSSVTGLSIGTTYHIRAYATNSIGTAYGQDVTFTTPNIPTLTTSDITSVTPVSGSGGGNITDDGGAYVTERGIVWSTSANPTTALTTKATSGGGTGTFYCDLTDLNASTLYHVRAYAINSAGTAYGEDKTFTTNAPVVPTLTTTDVTSITLNTASSGGEITATGGASVTARGVVWNTATGPTISLSTKTVDASGTGIFTSSLTGLNTNTTYYLRAYATNSAGTAYGPEVIFRTAHSTLADVEGNTYYAVQIGTQIWMRENLKTTKFRDGNFIPNITDNAAWGVLTTAGYCWYNNDATANKNTYGALYNWYTISDSRGLCPTGWHVPTDAEWTTMVTYLGGSSYAGGKMKETGVLHWSGNTGATNESGFTALPGGYRQTNGSFYYLSSYGYWWSGTEISSSAYYTMIYYYTTGAYSSNINKATGNSIRCIKDSK